MSVRRTEQNDNVPHNFAPASARDAIVFTAEQPGGTDDTKTPRPISNEIVNDWIAFIKEQQGIDHVLVLLSDDELEIYAEPGLLALYEMGGLTVHRVSMGAEGASKTAMGIINLVESKDEKIVTHCTGGVGRAGRVAAGWIATKYGLSPTDATEEAMEQAREAGTARLGDEGKLAKWLE